MDKNLREVDISKNIKAYADLNNVLKSKKWEKHNQKNGISIIIPFNEKLKNYSLKITRNYKKNSKNYTYRILNSDNIQIGTEISSDEFINQDKPSRDRKLHEIMKNDMPIKKDEFDKELQKINNLINEHKVKEFLEDNYSILKNNLKKIEENEKIQNNRKIRENKLYPEYDKEKVEEFEKILNKYEGNIIDYIQDKSQYLILNENNNISFIFLACISVILGLNGLLIDIHGMSDSGKSYIFDVVLGFLIPSEFQYDVNDITEASFLDKVKINPYFFDRLLIYLGDLGNKEKYEKIKPIFNILKIQISEKKYAKEKQGGKNYEKTFRMEIKGNVGALFCTVDKETNDSQMDSRTLNTTPVRNNRNEKFKFQDLIKNEGTEYYKNYNETIEELKFFREYLKYKINEYNKEPKRIIILSPFIDTLLNITKHSVTDTRKATFLQNMFKIYLILNHEDCMKIQHENITYIISKLKHLEKFITLSFNNAGLKSEEKNLILKLKSEINPITPKKVEILYEKIYKGNIGYKINIDEANKSSVDTLMTEKGLSETLDKTHEEKLIHPIYFFTGSTIKRKFKNHKAMKDISDINTVLNNLENRGYLGKLPEKYRKQNVYYLNKNEVEEIVENYETSEKDLENAEKYLKEYKFDKNQIMNIAKKWNNEFEEYKNK